MGSWLNCMSNMVTAVALAIGNTAIAVILSLVLMVGICIYGSGGSGFGACIAGYYAAIATIAAIVGGMAAAVLVIMAIGCYLNTSSGAGAAFITNPTATGGALRDPALLRDCAWARTQLSNARAQLDAATSARDAQARAVQGARNGLNAAIGAEAGAVAAVAAAALHPWVLPGALAALAAATALTASRARQLAEAEAELARRQAEVARYLADVAAAEALVLSLCGADSIETRGGVLDGKIPDFNTRGIRL